MGVYFCSALKFSWRESFSLLNLLHSTDIATCASVTANSVTSHCRVRFRPVFSMSGVPSAVAVTVEGGTEEESVVHLHTLVMTPETRTTSCFVYCPTFILGYTCVLATM